MALTTVETKNRDGAATRVDLKSRTQQEYAGSSTATRNDARDGTIDYAYILSAAHSGSTLLTMLLASHPDVASVGETSAIGVWGERDVGLCSCGASLRDCRFWTQIQQALQREGIDLLGNDNAIEFRGRKGTLLDRALRAEYRGGLLELVRNIYLTMNPEWYALRNRCRCVNHMLIKEIMRLTGARAFVDSSKQPIRLRFMMDVPGLRAKVIHLVRDGRGVAASYMRKSQWSMERSAKEWLRAVRSEQQVLSRFDENDVAFVRYEALCLDPAGTLHRLFKFLDVDPTNDFTRFRQADHHVLGNRMRMQGTEAITLDEKWRSTLNDANLKTFEEIGGAQNREFGYGE